MNLSSLQNLPARARLGFAAGGVAFIVCSIVLFRLLAAPSFVTVMAGMDPSKASEVSAALDAAGVTYELRAGGSELAVKSGSEAQARMALADTGADGGVKQPGFELLDKQKLGASNFQQQVTYQRALEGQIAQTISSIDGVKAAQVRITLPKDQLFADEAKSATAAVLLASSSQELDASSVRGVANLVAASVPDLKADKVTITDATGRLVWPIGDDMAAASGAGMVAQNAAEARYAQTLEASLGALIAQTVGIDKAQVKVAADLNLDQQELEKLEYDADGVPLKEVTESESLDGNGSTRGGTAGAVGNIPSYGSGATTGSGTRSRYRKKSSSTEVGVGKTVTRTKVAPGSVQRLDVALIVDKSVPAADQLALRSAISAAAGVQTDRGDTISLSAVTFATPPEESPAAPVSPLAGPTGSMIKTGVIAFGALLTLFFVARHLRRRERDPFAQEPSWLNPLPAGEALALPSGSGSTLDLTVSDDAESVFKADPRSLALEELIKREPERVAAQLRSWITEEDR